MHPNEKLLREAFASFERGDLTEIGTFLADDVVWNVGGENILSGEYKGREQVLGFFTRVAEITAGSVRLDVRDVLANDEHGIVLTTTIAKRGDEELAEPGVAVFELTDGRATSVWLFADDQDKMDAFFAS